MTPSKIVSIVIVLLISFTPTFTLANEAHEKLLETAMNLYKLSGETMSDLEKIKSLPIEKQLLYMKVKGDIDAAINCFQSIGVVYKIYFLSSGCKVNISETTTRYAVISKERAKMIGNNLINDLALAEGFELDDLAKNIEATIPVFGQGYRTLENLTSFMN